MRFHILAAQSFLLLNKKKKKITKDLWCLGTTWGSATLFGSSKSGLEVVKDRRSCKEVVKPVSWGLVGCRGQCWVLAGRSPDVGEHKEQVNMMEIDDIS